MLATRDTGILNMLLWYYAFTKGIVTREGIGFNIALYHLYTDLENTKYLT